MAAAASPPPPSPPPWVRDEPDSPCVQVCLIDPSSKLCIGCYRSAAEIAAWSKLDPKTRQEIKAQLPQRADQIKPKRRGGRRQRR